MFDSSPHIKTIDIELAHSLSILHDLGSYTVVRALVRLHGTPLGSVDLPVISGQVAVDALSLAIQE